MLAQRRQTMTVHIRRHFRAGIKHCVPLITLLLCVGAVRAQGVSTHSFAGCAFPDTAQAQCFNDTVEIACPAPGEAFYGQDAQYGTSASTPSYTIHEPVAGSQVTVDNRTGLMWASTGSNNGNTATWVNAIPSCEGSTFAGFTDWRLPNVLELASLVRYGPVGAPYINRTAFPGTVSGFYWASTTYVPDTAYAWYVLFTNGNVSVNLKTNLYRVRCVRGGP